MGCWTPVERFGLEAPELDWRGELFERRRQSFSPCRARAWRSARRTGRCCSAGTVWPMPWPRLPPRPRSGLNLRLRWRCWQVSAACADDWSASALPPMSPSTTILRITPRRSRPRWPARPHRQRAPDRGDGAAQQLDAPGRPRAGPARRLRRRRSGPCAGTTGTEMGRGGDAGTLGDRLTIAASVAQLLEGGPASCAARRPCAVHEQRRLQGASRRLRLERLQAPVP